MRTFTDTWRIRLLPVGVADPAALDIDGGGDKHGLLVLDQFEEVLTTWTRESREELVDRLARALERGDGRLRAVLTVRADYYGHVARHPALARLIGDNTVLVGPMTVSELRQTIKEPARLAGLELEEGFSDAVLADVQAEPGALPLLSTALLATWERRDGRVLRTAAYREAGGVAGAITRLADGVYGGLDAEGQATPGGCSSGSPPPARAPTTCAAGHRGSSWPAAIRRRQCSPPWSSGGWSPQTATRWRSPTRRC